MGLALMRDIPGQVKRENKMTGDRDGSHLWSLVINWLWSLLCPVISSWCRRWKGSAIYQHLRVNLSRPQRLEAAGAGADYQDTTPTARIFISSTLWHFTHSHSATPRRNNTEISQHRCNFPGRNSNDSHSCLKNCFQLVYRICTNWSHPGHHIQCVSSMATSLPFPFSPPFLSSNFWWALGG